MGSSGASQRTVMRRCEGAKIEAASSCRGPAPDSAAHAQAVAPSPRQGHRPMSLLQPAPEPVVAPPPPRITNHIGGKSTKQLLKFVKQLNAEVPAPRPAPRQSFRRPALTNEQLRADRQRQDEKEAAAAKEKPRPRLLQQVGCVAAQGLPSYHGCRPAWRRSGWQACWGGARPHLVMPQPMSIPAAGGPGRHLLSPFIPPPPRFPHFSRSGTLTKAMSRLCCWLTATTCSTRCAAVCWLGGVVRGVRGGHGTGIGV